MQNVTFDFSIFIINIRYYLRAYVLVQHWSLEPIFFARNQVRQQRDFLYSELETRAWNCIPFLISLAIDGEASKKKL